MHLDSCGRVSEATESANLVPWPEPPRATARDADHDLLLVFRGVTDREIRAVGFGQAAFALVVDTPLMVLCYRFGDAIPWSLAPYHWHRIPPAKRYVAVGDSNESEAQAKVRISLMEAEGNRLRVRRIAPLSVSLTRAWNSAIRKQAGKSCSEARYLAALAQFVRRYPNSNSLLSRAIATSVDGK
jgi:hypothetical protein